MAKISMSLLSFLELFSSEYEAKLSKETFANFPIEPITLENLPHADVISVVSVTF